MRSIIFLLTMLWSLTSGLFSPPCEAALPVAVGDQALPSLAPILRKVTPSVVNIHTETRVRVSSPLLDDPFFRRFFNLPNVPRERVSTSLGSGVIVDAARGYILTNHHVINNADDIAVTLEDGRSLKAELIGSDPDTDVAVIQIEPENLQALTLADSNLLAVGDFVVAVGNPFGLGQTVTSGIVSALGRSSLRGLAFQNFIQTDASINPGNSGGALINLRGELVGINTAIFTPSGGNVGIGFAIPSSMAQRIMRQLVEFGEVQRGTLGLEVQDLTSDLAAAFNIKTSHGAVISKVWPESPAAHAGLRAGDIIMRAGQQNVRNAQDVRNAEGLVPIGDSLDLSYLRNGREINATVRISAQEDIVLRGASLNKRLAGAVFTQKNRNGRRNQTWVSISQVEPNSAAWHEGLRENDIILAVNRRPVDTLNGLSEAVAAVTKRQQTLVLQIQRGRASYLVVLE